MLPAVPRAMASFVARAALPTASKRLSGSSSSSRGREMETLGVAAAAASSFASSSVDDVDRRENFPARAMGVETREDRDARDDARERLTVGRARAWARTEGDIDGL